MNGQPSSIRLVAREHAVRGLAIVAGGLWLVPLAGIVLFPTPGGEDPLLLGIFGGMAGLATAAWAGWTLRRWLTLRRLLAHGVAVKGRVLGVEDNAESVWALRLGYRFQGCEYQARIVTGSMPAYRVADTVSLLVDPARPSRTMIREEE
jgi:hypothetical protein